MASIKDVAEKAGVAPSTVSLVLNNKGYVSEATKIKVKKAMEELSYIPSDVARNLSLNKTNTIGFIVPSIAHPFFAELSQAMETALYSRNYKMMICSTLTRKNAEIEFVDMLKRKSMDGIIMGAHTLDTSIYDNIKQPVVAFDRFINKKIPIVHTDHALGGKLAAQAFLQHNPKHIVQIIGAQKVQTPAHAHNVIFQQELTNHGVLVDNYELPWNAFDINDYNDAVHHVFQNYKDIDGIFSADFIAASCLSLASSFGYSVPDNLKIVSYDGTDITQLGSTPLTTIRQPIEELAEIAAESIVALVNNTPLPDLSPIPPVLIKRKSC